MTHISVSDIDHHWTYQATSHYLSQCWNIINWTPSAISIKIHIFSFKKIHLKMSKKWRQFCSVSVCYPKISIYPTRYVFLELFRSRTMNKPHNGKLHLHNIATYGKTYAKNCEIVCMPLHCHAISSIIYRPWTYVSDYKFYRNLVHPIP